MIEESENLDAKRLSLILNLVKNLNWNDWFVKRAYLEINRLAKTSQPHPEVSKLLTSLKNIMELDDSDINEAIRLG